MSNQNDFMNKYDQKYPNAWKSDIGELRTFYAKAPEGNQAAATAVKDVQQLCNEVEDLRKVVEEFAVNSLKVIAQNEMYRSMLKIATELLKVTPKTDAPTTTQPVQSDPYGFASLFK